MSAKLMYSLSDENPDLQKQIGCMNGFFQLFDRHRYLAAGRFNSHSHKRLPPPGHTDNQGVEPNNRLENSKEKNATKVVKEKRRNSTESPRVSFSSSCSPSFSSLDYTKTAHLEPSPSSQTIFAETPSRDLPANHPISSAQLSQKSLDLRDVVKDSMQREARGLLVKTTAKEEAVFHTLKYRDSPRPSEPTKAVTPTISGLNDSFRVFGKLCDGPRNSNEEKDGRILCGPKDLRRLSYDGRESQDALKSNVKFRELPRLSLDSRHSSIRGSISETKATYLLNDPQIERRNCIEMTSLQQEPGSSKRASSVIAKLMGLVDPMPTTDDPLRQHNTLETEKLDPLSRSSRTTKVNKQDQFFGSPRNSQKDLTSQMKNADSVTKTTANQKIPIETAPWRQPHGNKGSQPPAFKCHEAPTKTPITPLTVYGEIEKRLADLEFTKSGKDLRALKQILEAMQKTKETLDTKKYQTFSSGAGDNKSRDHSSNIGGSQRNLQSITSISPMAKGSRAPKSYKSPIVIIKPTKLIGKNTDPASNISSIDNLLEPRKLHTSDSADNKKVSAEKRMTRHLTPRNTQDTNAFNRHHSSQDKNIRTAKPAQISKMSQSDSEENSGSSGRGSGNMSPRLQQRRFGLDKQFAPASPDSSKTRRQCSRQPMESSSPGRKCRQKSSHIQRTHDQSSDTRTNSRDLSHQGNTISLQSESNISFASDIDDEITSIIQSEEINSIYFDQKSQKKKKPTARFSVNRTMAEPGRTTSEQPSPVSVLDDAFYREDSPSPVKKKSYAFKDDETPYPDEVDWAELDLNHTSNSRSYLSTEVDHKILANNWAQNPQEINCTDVQQIIADTALLCDSTNPEHIYISDILSASNLLRKLESGWMNIQFHSSDHLINPNLLFALEQLKGRTRLLQDEQENEMIPLLKSDKKVQRKLVFDVVNEILVRKFVVTDSFTQWLSPDKLTGKKPRGEKLLKELCSEIDQLQGNNLSSSLDDDGFGSIISEDMTRWPMNLTEYVREIPVVVLDVERLIFKDLITEILSVEAAVVQGRSGGHCRQLFPK
ncbi:Protein LONGIFOLIA [Parasponia andersonii]|uniref:Protein LONGIFOLIA n=1 Tax=Parasponia andersonii TaxID=3476 RepID=A0A2P5BBQ2_PARAD|nr:Protein LONGIFOLIA [Parasponia andersonii]